MKRCIVLSSIVFGLVCGLAVKASAQAAAQPAVQPTDVAVCDVVKKPEAFNGKIVRIKGTVFAGFDEFAIKDSTDPNCGFEVNAIWLTYPQGTKGKAGPAALLTVEPARNFSGKFTPETRAAVTLDKSKDFKQFDSLLSQTHQKGADMCLGCARYEVMATLVGRLDTVADAKLKRDASGKIVGFGGFGNLNIYPARLVLESVSDITPKEIDYSKNDDATKGDTPNAQGGDINASIAMMQKAANALAASPAKDLAVKAVGAYPKSGEHNGVSVGFGRNNEISPRDETQGTDDSPDGVLFNVVFNSDRLQGNALSRAIVHMGTHISELRSPDPSNPDPGAYILESDAWVVTTIVAVTTGQKYLTLPGGYLVWNTTWPPTDRNDKMEATLKDFLATGAMLSR